MQSFAFGFLYRLLKRQVIITQPSSPWYKKPNLIWVEVDIRGGDGTGNEASYLVQPSSGGEAGRSMRTFMAKDLPDRVSVSYGGVGSTASFGTFMTAAGGSNGDGTTGAAGAGGTASGGDWNYAGRTGGGGRFGQEGYVIIREHYAF